MRKSILWGVLTLSAGLIGGCGGYGGHDYHARGDYREDYRDHAQQAGDRNTRISDIQDDGRLNGSARSFEERKASRAADQGDYDASRREEQLRRDREGR